MKKINIIYWIFTCLLIALMLSSIIGTFMQSPEGVKMMADLGYKPYIGPFLAAAKVLGIIAILVPGFPRLKEWAYAGFAFDMIGATYSMYATGMPFSKWGIMFVFLAILAVSYIYHLKRLKLKSVATKDAAV